MKRTTLYYDGIFHSGISEDDCFSCMEVYKGKIIGTYRERPKDRRFWKEISLGGAHVYPCLIDGHIHMLFTIASMAMGFPICEISSKGVVPNNMAAVEQKVCEYAAKQKKDALIAGYNFILPAIDQRRMPNREELDLWAGGRAIVIYNIDGHSTAMSSAMMRLVGIDPAGQTGVFQGEENERLQGRITDAVASRMGLSLLSKGIAKFQNACADYGISVVGALEGNGDSPKDSATALIVRLARHFDVGVRFYFQYMDIARVERLAKYQKHKRIGGCGDWEMDGAIGSHSAAFSTPYIDSGCCAPCYYEQEFVNEKVREADDKGYQIACHAIGELAIERITQALKHTKSHTLHRIEHAEFPTDITMEELKKGQYAIMLQPGYSWIDKRYMNTYTQYVSAEICARPKLKSLYDEGVCVCGSSDSPVQSLDPWLQMLGMVDFYNEEESISPYEAFRCYTVNPAKAILEEAERGTLEVGKAADFFTADQDMFTLSKEEIVGFRPSRSYYGGRPYRRKSGSVLELLLSLLGRARKV